MSPEEAIKVAGLFWQFYEEAKHGDNAHKMWLMNKTTEFVRKNTGIDMRIVDGHGWFNHKEWVATMSPPILIKK